MSGHLLDGTNGCPPAGRTGRRVQGVSDSCSRALAPLLVTTLKLWEGVRPGTVAKAYGQGHWAYGRVAAAQYGKAPRGGNNNEVLVDDYDRLSGATARNGGFTGVKVQKA